MDEQERECLERRLRDWLAGGRSFDVDHKSVPGLLVVRLFFSKLVEAPDSVCASVSRDRKVREWEWRGIKMRTSPVTMGNGEILGTGTKAIGRSDGRKLRTGEFPYRKFEQSGVGGNFWAALKRAFEAPARKIVGQ